MSPLGFGTSPVFFEHETGDHPECKERLSSILGALEPSELWDQLHHFSSDDRNILNWIEKVHLNSYIQEVEEVCRKGGGIIDQAPTYVGPRSYEAALIAVSTALMGAQKILDGQLQRCFCALRPPGHHARPHTAMGFCLFNNAAVAANYLLEKGNLKRILIVDFDVHHGNGTQEIFYENGDVFYFSFHQSPLYPGTGFAQETGQGAGRGLTKNILFGPGAGDREVLLCIDEEIAPIFERFQPEVLVLSAGFDAYEKDPLGGMNLTKRGYQELTRKLRELAQKYCQGRILSVLEGGYNLSEIGNLVRAHMEILAED